MKTVLFVPGYYEDINFRDYAATIKAIEKQGFKVTFVPIKWKRTTIEDWSRELDAVYANYDPDQTVLAGFSYGAMTAFISASRRAPSELWLFSLSPYFSKDLKSKNMKSTWLKRIGHRRVSAFNTLQFSDLAKSITCRTLLFVGQIEIDKWPVMKERSDEAHKILKNSVLTVIPNVGHDVADKRYITEIVHVI